MEKKIVVNYNTNINTLIQTLLRNISLRSRYRKSAKKRKMEKRRIESPSCLYILPRMQRLTVNQFQKLKEIYERIQISFAASVCIPRNYR